MNGINGQPRKPLPRPEVSALDLLAMRLKNEINAAAGDEAIDVAHRILVSCIADKVGPKTIDVVRTLRASTDAVALLLERLPGGTLQPLPAEP